MTTPVSSSTSKGKHGGARPGAGRKPTPPGSNPWRQWQLGVMLTPDEITSIKAGLTPGQRRHRLLCPVARDKQRQDVENGRTRRRASHKGEPDLKFAVLRVAIRDDAERDLMLALSVPERRQRLLTPPSYGDPCDERPGRWRR